MGRPTLRVTLKCNNACLFCAQRGSLAEPPVEAGLLAELATLRAQSNELTFVGGEPTLAPFLPGLIAAARTAGFAGVGVQSNGRRLAEPGYLRSLIDAGLTDLHLSIHGAEAAVHDYHVGTPGAFEAIVTTLAEARSQGLPVAVTTVLTRSNARVLPAMPQFLRGAGVAAWLITIPRTAGALAPEDDRISPRLVVALPSALQALQLARESGLPAWIQGAPLCLLGPFAARALPADEPRSYAAVCAQCPARARCAGVDAAYLAHFAGDELTPKAAAPAAAVPRVTRLFVGIGELAPPVSRAVPPVPVEPAVAEPKIALTQLGGTKS